ncbi:Probable jasmonic acid carboxyl methyltransferase 2 [Linum grandiflorum]
MIMDVTKVFHVNQGKYQTSYINNCTLQSKTILLAKPTMEEAVGGMIRDMMRNPIVPPTERLGIVELGCSSGPNAMQAVSYISDAIHKEFLRAGQTTPELSIFLNDLPSNDFLTKS